MAALVIASAAEAEALVGQTLEGGDGLLVDQARIDAFADATGDHQWIHVDATRAASGPFGATVAHGYLTVSLIPVLAADVLKLDFGSARVNYGSNKVRFPMPVRVDSTLRLTAVIVEVRREPQGTFLTTRYTVTADGAPKPACVAETVVLVVGEATVIQEQS